MYKKSNLRNPYLRIPTKYFAKEQSMAIYDYVCLDCNHKRTVLKRISEFERPESCPNCSSQAMQRLVSAGFFTGAKVEDASYNPAFGQVVRNSTHARQLAKERGFIEVGNDKMPTSTPNRISYEV